MVWDLTELISPEFFFKTEIQPNLYPSLQLVIISIFIYFLLGGGAAGLIVFMLRPAVRNHFPEVEDPRLCKGPFCYNQSTTPAGSPVYLSAWEGGGIHQGK